MSMVDVSISSQTAQSLGFESPLPPGAGWERVFQENAKRRKINRNSTLLKCPMTIKHATQMLGGMEHHLSMLSRMKWDDMSALYVYKKAVKRDIGRLVKSIAKARAGGW